MESRGSSHCVVLLLWFTKYTRPLGNIRFSVEGKEKGSHKGRSGGRVEGREEKETVVGRKG